MVDVPIAVLEPLEEVNSALLDLLRGFEETDWERRTVHAHRNVKDLTAHLLHGSLRRVSALRDRYHPPTPPLADLASLVDFIQRENREFMTAMRRISPGVLVEQVAHYDAELVSVFRSLDPFGPGLGVAWAGEANSENWFDMAREYTEKWHHQQQLREATGRPALYAPHLFAPVLETFARGLPHAYQRAEGAPQHSVALSTAEELSLAWTLVCEDGRWALRSGADPGASTFIRAPADLLWRLWTKGMRRDEARRQLIVTGDVRAAEPLLTFVAVMA